MKGQYLFGDDNDSKRTLGIRDKQILWRRARCRCENPTCGREIGFDEMQVGHKKAWSRGGRTTLKNSVCLCWRCNKLQGTDNWEKFLKKQGINPNQINVASTPIISVQPQQTVAQQVVPQQTVSSPAVSNTFADKKFLKALSTKQLKSLAENHGIKVKGSVEEGFLEDTRLAPTKSQYIKKLLGVVSEGEINVLPKKEIKKKRKKRSSDSWF